MIKNIRRELHRDAESKGLRPGYYLVKGYERHFISPDVNPAALDRVADRVLSDRAGWDYWIDYSSGPSTNGNPAWSNVDHVDRFI